MNVSGLSGLYNRSCAWNESYPIRSQKIETESKTLTAAIVSFIPIIIYYVIGQLRYHRHYSRATEQQLPPVHPHLLPFVGNTIPFIFDNANFLHRAT